MRFKTACSILALALLASSVFAMQSKPVMPPGQTDVAGVITRFAEAESKNRDARNNYTFTQDIDAMTIGEGGSITGRFHRISEIVYDDRGMRFEKITFFPVSTLAVSFTQEDFQDLAGVQPFALTTEDLPKYQVDFVGKEKIDELNTYVFDVKPKQIRKGERYLEGRIWVDDQDLQIVKVAGKSVPEVSGQAFPRFESFRENIDGRYWFPTYTYIDDMLEFRKAPSVHLKATVRYTNYKKFSGRIRIGDEGDVATEEDDKPAPNSKKVVPPPPPAAEQPKPEPPKPELKRKRP